MALNGSAFFSLMSGAHYEVIEVSRRTVAIPGLYAFDHGDALVMLVMGYFYLGEYAQSIAVVREALGQLRPGDPLAFLAEARINRRFRARVTAEEERFRVMAETVPSILFVTDADGRPVSRRDLRTVPGPGASKETIRRLAPRVR